MAEPQQKVTIRVPSDIDALGRAVLGDMLIDFIQDRTARGKDISGDNFARYSASYKDSDDFDVAGKSNVVNLELTGDTMASIELLSHETGSVTLGFESGSDENDKASWLAADDNGRSRAFLGINASDFQIVLRNYRAANPETEDIIRSQARSIFNRILGNG